MKDRPEAKLEFESKIIVRDFIESFLSKINQNTKGSFYGSQEGEAILSSFVKELDSEMTVQAVGLFIKNIIECLFFDKRKEPMEKIENIEKQFKKNVSLEDILKEILYLDHLIVAYGLRMNGRQMSELSPGEKGLLLLIFYTLLDRDDSPLIIDQPEENLDNGTIKDVLVPCLTEAKGRRQVIIVTHNPNLAIVCDSEQIIHSEMLKNKNKITYTYGSIEDHNMTKKVVDVLEGTMSAFDNRGAKYKRKIRF